MIQNNKGTKEAWKVILATVTENKNIDIYYSDKEVEEEKVVGSSNDWIKSI